MEETVVKNELNERCTAAKACGAMMAVVERMKNVTSGNWNDGKMMNSYGEALCRKPADYIKKLQKHFVIYQTKLNTGKFSKRMGEICAYIDISKLPAKFDAKEAASFYLGYVEEVNSLKEKSEKTDKENSENNNLEQAS